MHDWQFSISIGQEHLLHRMFLFVHSCLYTITESYLVLFSLLFTQELLHCLAFWSCVLLTVLQSMCLPSSVLSLSAGAFFVERTFPLQLVCRCLFVHGNALVLFLTYMITSISGFVHRWYFCVTPSPYMCSPFLGVCGHKAESSADTLECLPTGAEL